ncbi:hypothetical protein R7P64_04805 [Vibrio sp. 2304]|uniref:hypothetical protein n=1 Tax=Vibrio sp. 2304 TaxID=3074601 RepID=UPI0021D36202|nr:hypothetical protein [Vibrio sp. 2304]EJA7359172.1 hypothetical protein [Vibrio alginolyticus]MDW1999889.1 hypothetical protein [Vibrio sp. 2304]
MDMHNDLISINLDFTLEQAKYFKRKQEFHPYLRLFVEISEDEDNGIFHACVVDAVAKDSIHKIGFYQDYFSALRATKEWWNSVEIEDLMTYLVSRRNFVENIMTYYSITDDEYKPTKKEIEVLSLIVYEHDSNFALEFGQLPYSNTDILNRAKHYGVSLERSNLHRILKKLVSKNILIEEENTTLVWMDSGKGEGRYVEKKVKQYRQMLSYEYDTNMIEGWSLYLDSQS